MTTALHVAVSGWLLGEPSGANRRLLRIAQHAALLLRPDERITILHRQDFEPPGDMHAAIAWRAIEIPAGATWQRIAAERRLLTPTLRDLGATVLDHGLLPLPRVPVPTCLTIHDLRAVDGLTRWPRWLARRTVRTACRRATAVVVPSRFTAERVRAVAPATQPSVVANGVTVPAPETLQTTGNLLHIGHLEPRKNVDILLHALAKLPIDERPVLQLVGRDAGDGSRLRELAERLGVGGSVQFLGIIDAEQLAHLHLAARAIAVPSTYEGFGFAALDGLAFGRPTLVANAGALPEVVGDAGVVLPPEDARAWANAIADALVDPTDAPAKRRERAAGFSWPGAAQSMLEVWRRAAAIAPAS